MAAPGYRSGSNSVEVASVRRLWLWWQRGGRRQAAHCHLQWRITLWLCGAGRGACRQRARWLGAGEEERAFGCRCHCALPREGPPTIWRVSVPGESFWGSCVTRGVTWCGVVWCDDVAWCARCWWGARL